MLKLFLNTADQLLYRKIQLVFKQTELKFSDQYNKEKLLKELEKFQENPLSCTIGIDSQFEKHIKLKIKFMLGICFVFVPLTIFSFFSYLTGIDIIFAFLEALCVTLVISSRMETIAQKYVKNRKLELAGSA